MRVPLEGERRSFGERKVGDSHRHPALGPSEQVKLQGSSPVGPREEMQLSEFTPTGWGRGASCLASKEGVPGAHALCAEMGQAGRVSMAGRGQGKLWRI